MNQSEKKSPEAKEMAWKKLSSWKKQSLKFKIK